MRHLPGNQERMLMKRLRGDLIQLAREGRFDVIIHGCNCFCTMGGGIARQIRTVFPQAFAADAATQPGDRSKLGVYTQAVEHIDGRSLTVVNGYTQFDYAGPGVLADYRAIRTLFESIKTDFSGQRIGYPRIGAGLAGGDWKTISEIIDRALDGEDHTLVEFVRQAGLKTGKNHD